MVIDLYLLSGAHFSESERVSFGPTPLLLQVGGIGRLLVPAQCRGVVDLGEGAPLDIRGLLDGLHCAAISRTIRRPGVRHFDPVFCPIRGASLI